MLTPAQVLGRLTVVEDVDQQAPAIFHDADIAAESGIRKAVHASLHHMTFFICAFSLRFGSKHNYHTTVRKSTGRCQGGYCETRIAGLLEEVKHKNREDVLYSREGSNMFVGKVRD